MEVPATGLQACLRNSIRDRLWLFGSPHGFLNTQQSFLVLRVGHTNLPLHRPCHVLQLVNDLHLVPDNELPFWPEYSINFSKYSRQIAPVRSTKHCKIRQQKIKKQWGLSSGTSSSTKRAFNYCYIPLFNLGEEMVCMEKIIRSWISVKWFTPIMINSKQPTFINYR